MKKNRAVFYLLVFLSLIIVGLSIFVYIYYQAAVRTVSLLVVDKNNLQMKLVNAMGDTIQVYPIAVGTKRGDKQKTGDLKTPEGIYPVVNIENSEKWAYDFEDDTLGPIAGAYGPKFIRLDAYPHKGIGIHGTHDNSTIGKRVSHGCIRMRNEDLLEVLPQIKSGTLVYILKDSVVDIEPKKEKKAK